MKTTKKTFKARVLAFVTATLITVSTAISGCGDAEAYKNKIEAQQNQAVTEETVDNAGAATGTEETSTLEEELEAVRTENKELSTKNAELIQEVSNLTEQVAKLTENVDCDEIVNSLNEQVTVLNNNVKDLQKQLETAQKRETALLAKLKETKNPFKFDQNGVLWCDLEYALEAVRERNTDGTWYYLIGDGTKLETGDYRSCASSMPKYFDNGMFVASVNGNQYQIIGKSVTDGKFGLYSIGYGAVSYVGTTDLLGSTLKKTTKQASGGNFASIFYNSFVYVEDDSAEYGYAVYLSGDYVVPEQKPTTKPEEPQKPEPEVIIKEVEVIKEVQVVEEIEKEVIKEVEKEVVKEVVKEVKICDQCGKPSPCGKDHTKVVTNTVTDTKYLTEYVYVNNDVVRYVCPTCKDPDCKGCGEEKDPPENNPNPDTGDDDPTTPPEQEDNTGKPENNPNPDTGDDDPTTPPAPDKPATNPENNPLPGVTPPAEDDAVPPQTPSEETNPKPDDSNDAVKPQKPNNNTDPRGDAVLPQTPNGNNTTAGDSCARTDCDEPSTNSNSSQEITEEENDSVQVMTPATSDDPRGEQTANTDTDSVAPQTSADPRG